MDQFEKPPPGGDKDRGYVIIIVTSVMVALSSMVVALRVYTRIRIVRSFGLDDYVLLLAWVSETELHRAMELTRGNRRSVGSVSPVTLLKFTTVSVAMSTTYRSLTWWLWENSKSSLRFKTSSP